MLLKNSLQLSDHSLQGRLSFSFAISFFSLLMIAFACLFFAIETLLDERVDEDLLEDIQEYQTLYAETGLAGLIKEFQRETLGDEKHLSLLRLFNQNKTLIFSTDAGAWQGITHTSLNKQKQDFQNQPILESQSFQSQEFPVRVIFAQLSPQLYLQIAESTEAKQEIMELLKQVFAVVFMLTLPLAYWLIYIVAKNSVKGINAVSVAAAELERGNFEYRVVTNSKVSEILRLVEVFNSMAQRIKGLITEMREMTDNIAHDLRSPLGRIRAISEMALSAPDEPNQFRRAAENTLNECDRLLRLINTTLDVAEAEAGVTNCPRKKVDLSILIKDACELFEPVAEQKGLSLHHQVEDDCFVEGNLQSLQRMLSNLIDNAIKYTPEGGDVEVRLTLDAAGICVSVRDSGVGIPSSDQHRVFERFYRCDQSRNTDGCGLGLSYSRAVARAHGGDIHLKSEPSKHTIFTICLPNVAQSTS